MGQSNPDTVDPLQYLGCSQLQKHNNFRNVIGYKFVGFFASVNPDTESIFIKTFVIELSWCGESRSWLVSGFSPLVLVPCAMTLPYCRILLARRVTCQVRLSVLLWFLPFQTFIIARPATRMIALNTSEAGGPVQKCTPNLLPCRIQQDGHAAAMPRYWAPCIAKGAQRVAWYTTMADHQRLI